MLETLDKVAALKGCFMVGGDTQKARPADWQDLDDLSVLALTGQFTRVATRPSAPPTLSHRPEIPVLTLPAMADDLRPLLRRLLEDKNISSTSVIKLIASRGYSVNPVDWMPKQSDADLPPLYDPWRDWLDNHVPDQVDLILSAETWDRLPPHSRHRQLTELHGRDAGAARQLVEAIAPTVSADQRLRLLGCLRKHISEGDKDLLETFANDRSSKVKTLVQHQLARLGNAVTDDENAAKEVPDFLQLKRLGLLGRKQAIKARALKNDAQRKRRAKVLAQTTLGSVAEALDVSPDSLVDMWAMDEATDDIANLIARSGTDHQVARFAQRMIEHEAVVPQPLLDRLTADQKNTFGRDVMRTDDWRLTDTRRWISPGANAVSNEALTTFKALPELMEKTVSNEHSAQEETIAQAIGGLALIVDRDAASALLESFAAAGIMTADLRLTLLRLNAAL